MKKEIRSEHNGIPYVQINDVEIVEGKEEIVKEGQKVFLYEIKEDGNDMKFKIANPFHPDNCPQTGIKEITIIDKKKRHDPDITFSRVDDPITGIIYGTPIGIDQNTKQLTFKPIRLKVHQEYDMANGSDRQIWMVASRHSCMASSPYPSSHKPYYKVVDREQEAEQKIINVKTRTRALDLIDAMRDGELVDMATNLGVDSVYSSQATLKAELMSRAERNAKEFCEMYDNSNRQAVTIMNRCRTVGLITLDPNQGYLWKLNKQLGLTEAAAIRSITENAALMQTMDFESKQKSENFRKFATAKEKETVISKSEQPTAQPSPPEFLTSESIKNLAAKMEETIARVEKKEQLLDAKLSGEEKMQVEKVSVKTIEDYRKKASELKLSFTDETTIPELAKLISDEIQKRKGGKTK